MKLFVFISISITCFVGKAAGLKCYECENMNVLEKCTKTKVTTCGPDMSQIYCAKADYLQVPKGPFMYCNGNCTKRAFASEWMEEKCKLGTQRTNTTKMAYK